jgi:glucose-1-phosphate adenylyltransferase
VPFAGKYRIIDFTLSNCVNSGITNVAVLTQYRPHSLNDHIGIGQPWDLDRSRGGVQMLQPYLGRARSDWYRGTADAIYHNLWYVMPKQFNDVLILSGDHVQYGLSAAPRCPPQTQRLRNSLRPAGAAGGCEPVRPAHHGR